MISNDDQTSEPVSQTATNEDTISNDIFEKSPKPIEESEEIETNSENTNTIQYSWSFQLNDIFYVTKASKCFDGPNNYTKGCKWAPDGQCLITNSADQKIRLFNLPPINENSKEKEMEPVFAIKEGGLIYDFCWYPLMKSEDPSSCGFLSTSQGSPIHLFDAYTGQLRATYRGYNNVDEVESATCISFSPDGRIIYAGYRNQIKMFYTLRPGRDYNEFNFKDSTPGQDFQQGITSCIATNPFLENIYAVGDYSKTVGMYNERGRLVCLLCGHQEGLTQIAFSSDGRYLWAGARRSSELLCWDLRAPKEPVYSLHRKLNTAQRIYFDLTSNNDYIVTGNDDGYISIWDLSKPTEETAYGPSMNPLIKFEAHNDCVNGISLNPLYPILASSSGQRHNFSFVSSDSDSEKTNEEDNIKMIKKRRCGEATLKLWWCCHSAET